MTWRSSIEGLLFIWKKKLFVVFTKLQALQNAFTLNKPLIFITDL
nr:MAG TPA: hypothetical protein [Caudoviricetes sp.]